MSTGERPPTRSTTSGGKLSSGTKTIPPPPTTLTPENTDATLEPCAATASFFLYAQRNLILVVHHDTLAIERRFALHREDVVWIAVDNASEKAPGRLAVSFDAGNTAIVWDILTGSEVARFSAYEHMKVAAFMRNGNIAFGNDQGNIILFEPSTSEHISARTIFDPITSIAPSADCRTFAIGYLNGSILIATLQPSFTILHTLTTNRAPSRITGLAWHGSSSKQKTDMLATQTMDGDLRVWSIPKPPLNEPPTIIRVLQRADFQQPGPCWFAWSKNGRIVQHAEGETRAWDVRTKKVSWENVPTVDGVTGMANYGPGAVLFTLSHGHYVQQYDINPNNVPILVKSVQHVPANVPPTPPTMLDERKDPYADTSTMTETTAESSADEAAPMSPLQKIAREMDSLDALESEIRDKVMPLSPTSSRTSSSVSSRSSGQRRQARKYLYDRPSSSRGSATTGDVTEFSVAGPPPPRHGHESMSIRSASSFQSTSRYRTTSNLRKEIMRSPEESVNTALIDLFPHARARLKDVPFRTPHYGNVARTPELLQREMLSVIFGWNDTARSLVRDEMQRLKQGSPSGVLLSKWLGDVGADSMASMIGTQTMTSSDWMLLALSSIGQDSQKKVGETFVQRLLEKGDVHPAVAILIGLGEYNDAIESYVAQGLWLEAVLLTCLMCPSDWSRIAYLIRKWGEAAVTQGNAELAVRCFSCTSIETSEPWFSPRAQDAAFTAQQQRFTEPPSSGGLTSPPLSPPSRSGSGRLAQKNASLRLITKFGDKGAPIGAPDEGVTPMNAMGVTPIAQSALYTALSPGGAELWPQPLQRERRDPSTTRTATPGGASRRRRFPSRDDSSRGKVESIEAATPITAARDFAPPMPSGSNRRTSSVGSSKDPATAVKPALYNDKLAPESALRPENQLPSPSQGLLTRLREDSRPRTKSMERKPDGLVVQVEETRYTDNPSPSTASGTNTSTKSGKGRAIDDYISSVDEAREQAREKRSKSKRRADSRKRDDSRGARGNSRPRETSETRGRNNVKYIKPAKRSPSSPIPMSPEEIAQAVQSKPAPAPAPATSEDESFYKMASPVDSHKGSLRSYRSEPKPTRKSSPPPPSGSEGGAAAATARARSRDPKSPIGGHLQADSGRGRTEERKVGSSARSPSSPLPMPTESRGADEFNDANSDGRRIRLRTGSHTREDIQTRRADSAGRREKSSTRSPISPADASKMPAVNWNQTNLPAGMMDIPVAIEDFARRPRGLSKKELAAKELEERRLSLARRPSAPSIPLPGEGPLGFGRPPLGSRAITDQGDSPSSYKPPFARSQTVDPDQMSRYGKITGTSTPSAPIGLPATPRAMRHPRYMSSDPNETDRPPVPEVPDNASSLSSVGSSLSQVGSNLSQVSNSNVGSASGSYLTSNLTSNMTNLTQNTSVLSSNQSQVGGDDGVGPLLPSTVFSQKGSQGPSRASSAPPSDLASGVHPAYNPTLPSSTRRLSHVRKISPPDPTQVNPAGSAVSSIDEALAGTGDQQVVVVQDVPEAPPMLPELQHLAGPPPPPPPPTMYGQGGPVNNSGVISIAMDDEAPPSAVDAPTTLPTQTYPHPMERATTTSPNMGRRGRNSVSESFGSRWRGFGDKMRSSSKNRTKSPQQEPGYKPSPYETVLPPMPSHHRQDSSGRAKSPYEQAMAAQKSDSQEQIPPPPPPAPLTGNETRIQETTIPPSTLPRSQSAQGGYRNPKEIRANMPPETLQSGVYGGGAF